jgi:glycosyltransferase involved in cell wall biosynthesis
MKIAILSSFLDNIGGAEIVSLTLAREFNADIFTTCFDEEKIKTIGFSDVLPRIFSIGQVPKKAPFRHQLTLYKFRKLNLGKKYDRYIISGDWAMSGAVNNHPNLWYIHSPLNELWAFRDYLKKEILSAWKKPLYDIFVCFNRFLSRKYAKKVDIFVCNSINTQNRLKKYYQINNSVVINPPTDTNSFNFKLNKNYWLSVNRLITHKQIDIQLKAFSKLPNERLIIVGSYERGVNQFESYKKYIEEIKPQNVSLRHWVNNEELKKMYSECKGFITTAKDEDFGMTPVEAMASGKPVIASNDGGYKETVINGQTGVLIDEINENKLAEAIKEMSAELNLNPDKYHLTCQEQAQKFDVKIFVEKIRKLINEY